MHEYYRKKSGKLKKKMEDGEGDQGSMKVEEFGKKIAEEVSEMINKW